MSDQGEKLTMNHIAIGWSPGDVPVLDHTYLRRTAHESIDPFTTNAFTRRLLDICLWNVTSLNDIFKIPKFQGKFVSVLPKYHNSMWWQVTVYVAVFVNFIYIFKENVNEWVINKNIFIILVYLSLKYRIIWTMLSFLVFIQILVWKFSLPLIFIGQMRFSHIHFIMFWQNILVT